MAAVAVIIACMGGRKHAAKKDVEVVAFASMGCEDNIARNVEAQASVSMVDGSISARMGVEEWVSASTATQSVRVKNVTTVYVRSNRARF